MLGMLDDKWVLFVKVTELGSLTHAAAVLDIPQSVISRQIGMLERQCGARVFRRTGRGVVLTDFGARIFPGVKALIAQADQLSDVIRTSSGEPLGDVRLGLLPSSVLLLTKALYQATIERFPKVRLHFTEGSSVQLEDWLNQSRLDLSLLVREDETDRPDEPTIGTVSLSLIGRAGDVLVKGPTVAFDRLAEVPLVLPGEPHVLRARLNRLALERKLTLRIHVEADSLMLQTEVVAAGGGYAIMAVPANCPWMPATLSAARIIEPTLNRRVVLSTTLLRPHTLATRAVSRLVQELAPQAFSTTDMLFLR